MDPLSSFINLLPFAVIAASFLGSIHCVGMCGGLILAVCPNTKTQISYHLFRLLGYLSLGAMAAAFGQKFLKLGHFLNIFSLLVFVLMFCWMGLKLFQDKPLHMGAIFQKIPFFKNLWTKTLEVQIKAPSSARAGFAGFLTPLLPCGWLYSYVLLALGAPSIFVGMSILFFFWLGTLPALTISLAALGSGAGWVKRFKPKLVGLLFLLAGVGTVWAKVAPQFIHGNHISTGLHEKSCH